VGEYFANSACILHLAAGLVRTDQVSADTGFILPVHRAQDEDTIMTLTLSSPAFASGGDIPAQFTCDGADTSPPLAWSGVPAKSASLVLIVDDPDAPDPVAPTMTWVHWVVFNIPPEDSAVDAGQSPKGAQQGLNDWKQIGYRGPCPPIGQHRYFFKLYALDIKLPDVVRATKAHIESAMQGHILAQTQLLGRYRH
jgi:Raf kinase inhibitor-like YbhB/YbcL family protein